MSLAQERMAQDEIMEVRIDKWLWAARFFKTRSLAKNAVESGKVHIDGQKAKPSKNVAIGMVISVRQGLESKTLTVTALSDQRKAAPDAALLYEESFESQQKRELIKQAARHLPKPPSERPNKKQRRELVSFKKNY
ncbi:MAG: ribosome-associated heat shock protein Hsp15 [Gammaproteobacteria bacterium]|nr:ribosome-associated heat shock protein Hsp15 [Gammaproteobacteria bacterium]